MKILITGGNGMLGSDLCAALSDRHEVYAAGMGPYEHLEVPFESADLTNLEKVVECVSRIQPELIIHTAAMTDVDGCESERERAALLNTGMVRNLDHALTGTRCFLIHFSTDYVFDGKKEGPYEETDATDPQSVYGATKRDAEEFLLSRKTPVVIFRLCWLYGIHGKSFPRTILKLAQERDAFKVVHDQRGRPTYTADIAAAIAGLLQDGSERLESVRGEIIHLASEGTASWAEFAEAVLREGGFPRARVERVPTSAFPRPAKRPANSVLSLNKLNSMLGISLRPWREALPDFLSRLSREGY